MYFTVNHFCHPAASCPLRYHSESEWITVGVDILITASYNNRSLIRAKSSVGCAEGGTVVIGIRHLNGYSSCGCL